MSAALVSSGGASLGAVQVGMLQALVAHRVRPDLIVGTSVGAINAAWVAGDPRGERLGEVVDCGGRCAATRFFWQVWVASFGGDPGSLINGLCEGCWSHDSTSPC